MKLSGVLVLAPEPCRRCGRRFEVDTTKYRRQPKTCPSCVRSVTRQGLDKPADPAAMRGIQQVLDGLHGAWEDTADPRPQANATCPNCGAAAEHVTQDLSSAGLRQETWRCLADGPRCRTTIKHSEITTPTPREEIAPMMSDRGPDEDLPPKMFTCACGCGELCKPGRKFASCSCSNRFNASRRKESQPAVPPVADLSRPETWSPGAVVLQWDPSLTKGQRGKKASAPAGEPTPTQSQPPAGTDSREHARLYLLSLTSEQRTAYLELINAEALFLKLGGR